MRRLTATFRIASTLASMAAFVVLCAYALGLDGSGPYDVMQGRVRLCEAVALHASTLVSQDRIEQLQQDLQILVQRNSALRGIQVLRGDQTECWIDHRGKRTEGDAPPAADDSAVRIEVPVLSGSERWGTVAMYFDPLRATGWRALFSDLLLQKILFVVCASLSVYYCYLKRVLQHLDPSRVIPARVRTAFDTLVDGVLVLDEDERIVLANRSFATQLNQSPEELQGQRADELPWQMPDEGRKEPFPWTCTLRDGKPQLGRLVHLKHSSGSHRVFLVNASPILAEDGRRHGVLVSFDDVTVQEQRKTQLKQALQVLEQSREQIRRQNEELIQLATRDPLTGVLNRRSFFFEAEHFWQRAKRTRSPIACVMVDVDHFKSINDKHGHAMGDRVLKEVALALTDTARGLVCRYGGEEFCVLLNGYDLHRALDVAEQIRVAVASARVGELTVTASLGVTDNSAGPASLQEMMDVADQWLYCAKRTGRNRVMGSSQRPPAASLEAPPSTPERSPQDEHVEIPFPAVTALISALSYRDARTAEHSRRVADMCVEFGRQFLGIRHAFVLEVAALLHDIGKIGIPDSILLKAGSLTDDEWKIMRLHDRMGVDMIRSSFDCDELAQFVEMHHAWYGGSPENPSAPRGEQIPLEARILAIADAYDAMVSDRVYRPGMSRDEAFAELRRCAGRQFDPNLVERFIEMVSEWNSETDEKLETVSKQVALRIGLQIERLTEALDQNDLPRVRTLAERVGATARQAQLEQIAELAIQLSEAAKSDSEADTLVTITADLIDLCRLTQRAYLDETDAPRARELRPTQQEMAS